MINRITLFMLLSSALLLLPLTMLVLDSYTTEQKGWTLFWGMVYAINLINLIYFIGAVKEKMGT